MSIKRCTWKKSPRSRATGSPVTVPPPGDYAPLSTKKTLYDHLLDDLKHFSKAVVWENLCDYVAARYPNLKTEEEINRMATRLAKGVLD